MWFVRVPRRRPQRTARTSTRGPRHPWTRGGATWLGATVAERLSPTSSCATPRATSSASSRVGRTVTDAGKVATMRDAVREFVRDGDTVAIEGFTHLICFAAGHEIIRQGRRDLTFPADARRHLRPDDRRGRREETRVPWLGNPGVARSSGARPSRRRTGAARSRSTATSAWCGTWPASNLPSSRSARTTRATPREPAHRADREPIRRRDRVRGAASHPDVAIVHAQRADAKGARRPGLLAPEGGGVRGRARVIVVCESTSR